MPWRCAVLVLPLQSHSHAPSQPGLSRSRLFLLVVQLSVHAPHVAAKAAPLLAALLTVLFSAVLILVAAGMQVMPALLEQSASGMQAGPAALGIPLALYRSLPNSAFSLIPPFYMHGNWA